MKRVLLLNESGILKMNQSVGSRNLLQDPTVYVVDTVRDQTASILAPNRSASIQGRSSMRICVMALSRKRILLDVEPDDTIGIVKNKVKDKEGIPIAQMRFAHEGRMLQNDMTLADYDIRNESVVHLFLELKGS